MNLPIRLTAPWIDRSRLARTSLSSLGIAPSISATQKSSSGYNGLAREIIAEGKKLLLIDTNYLVGFLSKPSHRHEIWRGSVDTDFVNSFIGYN